MSSNTQKECHIRLEGFADLARMACAYHEHPRRVYSLDLGGTRMGAVTMNLVNTLAVMYAPLPEGGGSREKMRYVSYKVDAGREVCDVSGTTSNASSNAPIIHLQSGITRLAVAKRDAADIPDVFSPVELEDIGSLARITYDPEFPDESNLALYAVPMAGPGGAWALGYVAMHEMEEIHYEFYHVVCNEKPDKPFLRYGHDGKQDPEMTDAIEHGYSYLPIIKVGEPHPIFGFCP